MVLQDAALVYLALRLRGVMVVVLRERLRLHRVDRDAHFLDCCGHAMGDRLRYREVCASDAIISKNVVVVNRE